MATKEMQALRDKLKQRDSKSTSTEPSIKADVAEWKATLEALYSRVMDWTQSLQAESLVSIVRSPVQLHEESGETYECDQLTLRFGEHLFVELTPFQRFFLDTRGRVNVSCLGLTYMLLREQDDHWVIVWDLAPMRTEALTEASFAKLLNHLVSPAFPA